MDPLPRAQRPNRPSDFRRVHPARSQATLNAFLAARRAGTPIDPSDQPPPMGEGDPYDRCSATYVARVMGWPGPAEPCQSSDSSRPFGCSGPALGSRTSVASASVTTIAPEPAPRSHRRCRFRPQGCLAASSVSFSLAVELDGESPRRGQRQRCAKHWLALPLPPGEIGRIEREFRRLAAGPPKP